MKRVLLRAASGPKIGMGHAMRSLAVAHQVRELGGDPLLVLDDGETAGRFATQGYETLIGGSRPDWTSIPAAAAWFDGFWDWSPEMREVRAGGAPCVLIENRTPARELAELVVYPALHHRPDEWDAAHPERVLAGAPWIPLTPGVLAATPAAERDVDLLVTFGGSDPLRSTERVLRSLSADVGVVVVAVGVHMRSRITSIQASSQHLPSVHLLPVGSGLAEWMTRSRRALSALGTSLYEMAHLGVSAAILANYEADLEALEHYRAHGPHRVLGIAPQLEDEELSERLSAELAQPAPVPMSIPGLGEGARTLAQRLLELEVDEEVLS